MLRGLLGLVLGPLEAIDRRLDHRLRLLCHLSTYGRCPGHTWQEAGKAVDLDIRIGD